MVTKAFAQTKTRLAQSGIESPEFEARVIFEELFGRNFGMDILMRRLDRVLSYEESARLESMISRRISGEPLQYIIGEWEFYGLGFKVGKGVLIPRQDTETLVDAALDLLKEVKQPKILDLCSGTGCIPIAISYHLKDAQICAPSCTKRLTAILKPILQITETRLSHAGWTFWTKAAQGSFQTLI